MNWKQRIEKALQSGDFTLQDELLAGSWHSCAVGERLRITDIRFDPRDGGESTLSPILFEKLRDLGMRFADCVANQRNPKLAAKLYKQINEIRLVRLD